MQQFESDFIAFTTQALPFLLLIKLVLRKTFSHERVHSLVLIFAKSFLVTFTLLADILSDTFEEVFVLSWK